MLLLLSLWDSHHLATHCRCSLRAVVLYCDWTVESGRFRQPRSISLLVDDVTCCKSSWQIFPFCCFFFFLLPRRRTCLHSLRAYSGWSTTCATTGCATAACPPAPSSYSTAPEPLHASTMNKDCLAPTTGLSAPPHLSSEPPILCNREDQHFVWWIYGRLRKGCCW